MVKIKKTMKDLILSDLILLYTLIGIILSALYGVLLAPLIQISSAKCILNASFEFRQLITALQQAEFHVAIKNLVPFIMICLSFVFMLLQHISLENSLSSLENSKKQGGILKLLFFNAFPWGGFFFGFVVTGLWLPFMLTAWSAVLLIACIIFTIYFCMILIMIIRMRYFILGTIFMSIFLALAMVVAFTQH